MEIRKGGVRLDLGADFSIQIEDTNPVWNDRGSQSVPATVPVTRRNTRILSGVHRADAGENPNLPEQTAEVIDGSYRRRGALNVTEAGRREGITFNIGFDNSTAYQKWEERALADLKNLPVRGPGEGGQMWRTLQSLYKGTPPTDERDEYQFEDMAIFPIAVNMEEDDSTTHWELLNATTNGADPLEQPLKVWRTIDKERTEVSVPAQYGITPFLKIWKVAELIFQDLGLTMKNNPLREDPELERIVVLNNTADAICRNEINYRDLMPDCSVKDFLESLWVRFGLTFHIDYDEMTVELCLLKDILKERPSITLDKLATDFEFIRYVQPQYLKLSAGTKLDGAAPATSRWEDFIRGLDVKDVKMGADVRSWQQTGQNEWDRELYDGYIDDREYPDPEGEDYPDRDDPYWEDDRDDDRDEGRDDDRDDDRDYYSVRARLNAPATKSDDQERTMLAREFITGIWYKLDTENGRVRSSSTSFFDWDPATEGMDSMDLSSADECVPVKKIYSSLPNGYFSGYIPTFLVGSRHFHSYIVGNDDEEDQKEETPLAFMIAYTSGGRTVGRLSPETESGARIVLDDGSKPTLTLFFQFADGLFAQYWKDFDEILRHGNREIEVPARIKKCDLRNIDILKPVRLNGLRCMIDKINYTLPSAKDVDVEMVLRALQTQGEYDIKTEQSIPDFSVIRHLEWRVKEQDDLQAVGQKQEMLAAAIRALLDSGFKQTPGYDLVTFGVQLLSEEPIGPEWTSDTSLGTPSYAGQRTSRRYNARFSYDVYECRELSNGAYERRPTPAGRVTIEGEYYTLLVARWVAN